MPSGPSSVQEVGLLRSFKDFEFEHENRFEVVNYY